MKIKVFLILSGLVICHPVLGEDLITSDGATYANITLKRADPDGLYIEYTPAGGGIGMSKVKFWRLSAEQQKQFNYVPEKAREFEANVAQAKEEWRQELIRMDNLAKAERQAQQIRDEQAEEAAAEREFQLKQLEMQAHPAGGIAEAYSWSGGEGDDRNARHGFQNDNRHSHHLEKFPSAFPIRHRNIRK